MRNYIISLLLVSLLPLAGLRFAPANSSDITGTWRMKAHRISPARNGISDLYTHFKDLYGGCREDMGMTLNTDGTLTVKPVKGCQNPLGDVIMKAATKFMPSGATSWETTENKIRLKDKKGKQQEYELAVSGSEMQWGFDEKDKEGVVRHTIEFIRE